MLPKNVQAIRAFWRSVKVARSDEECWPWIGPVDQDGCAITSLYVNTPTPVHAVAYELVYGMIISGRFILHRCLTQLCCNPTHLFEDTNPDGRLLLIANAPRLCQPRRSWEFDAPIFQAYFVNCLLNGKGYVGITSATLTERWNAHLSDSKKKRPATGVSRAIARYGADAFEIHPICYSGSWEDICALESILITQWGTRDPGGYNLKNGGGGKPNAATMNLKNNFPRMCRPPVEPKITEIKPKKEKLKLPRHRSPIAKLKEADVIQIRSRRANGESLTAIGVSYGVSKQTIHNVVAGKCWNWFLGA